MICERRLIRLSDLLLIMFGARLDKGLLLTEITSRGHLAEHKGEEGDQTQGFRHG